MAVNFTAASEAAKPHIHPVGLAAGFYFLSWLLWATAACFCVFQKQKQTKKEKKNHPTIFWFDSTQFKVEPHVEQKKCCELI